MRRTSVRVHLDTDIGGDIDDLCALAMLLRRQDIELTGITTVAERHGKRAGYVRHVLDLEHRAEIPVAAGADIAQGWYRVQPDLPDALGVYRVPPSLPDDIRYWGREVAPSPNPVEDALALLKHSIEQRAVVVGIGPFTNLALLEKRYPGILRDARVFLMGGYVFPPREGFPQRDYRSDYNVQVDVASAQFVLERASPTLITLAVTVETSLRRAYVKRLRECGELGRLLARQAEAYAEDERKEERYGETCPEIPPDTINFQHDPLACAIAAGWNAGVVIRELPLRIHVQEGWLVEEVDPRGRPMRIVTQVDGPAFNQFWVDTVCGANGWR